MIGKDGAESLNMQVTLMDCAVVGFLFNCKSGPAPIRELEIDGSQIGLGGRISFEAMKLGLFRNDY